MTCPDIHPAPPRNRGLASFTLIELLVVAAIILLLGCILIPKMTNERRGAYRNACIGNLKQIVLSFKVWALDNNDLFRRKH